MSDHLRRELQAKVEHRLEPKCFTTTTSVEWILKRRDTYIQSEAASLKSEDLPSWPKLAHHSYSGSETKNLTPSRSNDTSIKCPIKQEFHGCSIGQASSTSRFSRLDQSQLGDAVCSTDYGSSDVSEFLESGKPMKKAECSHREDVKPITRTQSGTSISDVSSEDSYFESFAPRDSSLKANFQSTTVDSSDTSDYGSITEEDMAQLEILEKEALAKLQSVQHHSAVPVKEPELCVEQRRLVESIMQGNNVFYTGSAGCGKSTVLNSFVRKLRNIPKRVDIVAPTGAAALNVSGCTLQSYIGWGWGSTNQPLSKLKQDVHRKRVWKRVTSTDVLVIDEISMVENHCLERLNILLKEARADQRAFGGVQLIVTGDFCQLPPVKPFKHCIDCGDTLSINRKLQRHTCSCGLYFFNRSKWAFHSKAWEEANFLHVNLTIVHRQLDPTFRDILEKVRLGRSLSSHDTSLLMQHDSDTDGAVQLFPRCSDAKDVNDAKLHELNSPGLTYESHDMTCMSGDSELPTSESYLQTLEACSLFALDSHRFEKNLTLKVGMPIVLLINLSPEIGLVNGSQGIITGFQDTPYDPPQPKKYEDQDENDYWRRQLQWKAVRSFIKNLGFARWPVIMFDNRLELAVHPHAEDYDLGHVSLVRAQIPLLPAWAISIHRSQGMTLSRVVVDLAKCFEKGQAYVALSRARSLEGLCVKSMHIFPLGLDRQVEAFLCRRFNLEANLTLGMDPV